MTGLPDQVKSSPSKVNLIRDVYSVTHPDNQRRLLDIKKYFLDVIEPHLTELTISPVPYMTQGV